MRCKDREVTAFEEKLDILDRAQVMRLAMVDNGIPYVVPVNFGYTISEQSVTLYVHAAGEGRKISALKENPSVCFEVDSCLAITKGTLPCDWSADFESIIGFGKAEFVQEREEKICGLNAIMTHYGFDGALTYDESLFARTVILRVLVTDWTGKQKITSK